MIQLGTCEKYLIEEFSGDFRAGAMTGFCSGGGITRMAATGRAGLKARYDTPAWFGKYA
jgi:hypothetical protein